MVAPTSFFSDYGGHIRILEETLALQEVGNRITIATYYKGRDLPEIDIRRTAPLPYHTEYEVGSSRHKLAFDVYLAVKTLQVAWRERPDIIHGHMHEGALIGWVVARLLGVPLVFDFQGSLTGEMVDHGFLDPTGRLFSLVKRVEQFIDHRADAILTSSRQVRRSLQDTFNVSEMRIRPLPDCVDVDRFNAGRFSSAQLAAVRRHLGIAADDVVVAYLGLLTDYQGIPHILQAAARLKEQAARDHSRPQMHFLLMGFPNVPHYRRMAETLGVAEMTTFTGKIPYDEAPLYLSTGDIAVTAKLSTTEGSGKLLNYMALQLPVVAYDTAVHREYLGEHGVYVAPHDIGGFADAIVELAADPAVRERIGQTLRRRVCLLFTWPAAAQRIDALYAELIGN